jgi:hypothetical protein
VYIGLKKSNELKLRLSDCIKTANELNLIIQKQNDSLQTNMVKLRGLNSEINTQQGELLKSAVRIQKLENRKIPWYLHPVTYIIVGISTGVFIAK